MNSTPCPLPGPLPPPARSGRAWHAARRRGSILLVTAIFGAAVALALGSFIVLSVHNLKLGHRSFQMNGALNLCESGVEHALYAINNSNWTDWSTHSSGSDNKVLAVEGVNLGQGMVGTFKVVVFNASTSPTPRIVAEATVTPTLGNPLTKQIEVQVQRRSHWANGMVARDSIKFSGGNAYVDSYISDDPNYSTGGLYSFAKRRDHGSAGSIKVTTDAISLSNADIWGYVATGGSWPQAGPNGTVLGADSPTVGQPGYHNIDPNRVATDFSANFDPVTVPPTGSATVVASISGNYTLGSTGTNSLYVAGSVGNTNGKTIHVYGNVTVVVSSSVDIKGELNIHPDSSLTVYVRGDFEVGGNGIVNQTGLPQNMIIYGTAPTEGGQTVFLHGNGVLHAAVYAPNAHIELKGGGSSGEMSGSVVGYDIKITGNYSFHYDEALAKLGGGNPFSIAKWRELITAAEQVSL